MAKDRICVRLSAKAQAELEKMKNNGLNNTQCINTLLENTSEDKQNGMQIAAPDFMIHFAAIQNELEFLEDAEGKNNIRKELDALCRTLNLYPKDM